MSSECGICEYKGDWTKAPLFICLNCADAIRRLVWIRNREQQAAESRHTISQAAAAIGDEAAAPYRR